MTAQKGRLTRFTVFSLRISVALLIFCLMLSSVFACKPKEMPPVEFEGTIYIKEAISVNGTEYSEEVKEWLSECNNKDTSTTSTFVLSYKEKLTTDNYRFHYLVYRRALEKNSKLALKTLKNNKVEIVELNYCFANGNTDSDVLTYVCYDSTKKPVLDIIDTDSSSSSEYCGYIETVAYEPFGITIDVSDADSDET